MLIGFGIVAFALFTKRKDIVLPIGFAVCTLGNLVSGNGIAALLVVVAFIAMAVLCVIELTAYLPKYKGQFKNLWFLPAALYAVSYLLTIIRMIELVAYGYGIAIISYLFRSLIHTAVVACGLLLTARLVLSEENATSDSSEERVTFSAKFAKNTAPVSAESYCDLAKHALLLLLTFGIWNLIWVYKMTGFTNGMQDKEDRNPTTKLLLYIFVPLYSIYWTYKTAQRIDKMAAEKDVASNLSAVCLILSIIAPIISSILLQEKLNEIVTVDAAEAKIVSAHVPAMESGKAYCDLIKHVLLLLLTFGIWNLIWIYEMTEYTNGLEDEEDRNPTTKLLLSIFVPCYSIYWMYRTAQRVDKIARSKNVASNLSTISLILAIFAAIVPTILLQDKVNAIVEAVAVQEPEKTVQTQKEAPSVTEELKAYKELLDTGAITQEEYDAKKAQLLGL